MPTKKDVRHKIMCIMSDMLDNPDECGIYPTTVAYDRIERLIREARIEGVSCGIVSCYTALDVVDDPRKIDFSGVVERAKKDLSV